MEESTISKYFKKLEDYGWKIKYAEIGQTKYQTQSSKVKGKHKAPKTVKGDYDLSIHGNTIVLVDNTDGTTVEAKCHPDDEFDIGVGVSEAFRKINEKRQSVISVGDEVEIIDTESVYTSLESFFFSEQIPFSYAVRYAYSVKPKETTKGKVVYIKNNIVLIDTGVVCYLVNIKGLRKVVKQ